MGKAEPIGTIPTHVVCVCRRAANVMIKNKIPMWMDGT
jgi:hypothetical protein